MDHTQAQILAQMRSLGINNASAVIDDYAHLHNPELYQRLVPRRTPRPNGYPDPRLWVAPALSEITNIEHNGGQHIYESVLCRSILSYLYAAAPFQFPVLFLSEELAQAFTLTDIDDSFNLRDLPWPYPAFSLVLPERFAIPTPDGPAPCLLCARPEKVQHPPAWLRTPNLTIELDSSIILGAVVSELPCTAYGSTVPSIVEGMANSTDVPVCDRANLAELNIQSRAEPGLHDELASLNRQVAKFLGLTLLYLQSAGTGAVSGGERTRKEARKGERIIEALYAPKIIGSQYRIPHEPGPSAGTHASPIAHPRRGHLRQQAYGPQHSLRRPTWINPVMVGVR